MHNPDYRREISESPARDEANRGERQTRSEVSAEGAVQVFEDHRNKPLDTASSVQRTVRALNRAANDAEGPLEAYALQQAVVATLGKTALAGASLADLFNEAVRLVHHTLGVDYVGLVEFLPASEELLVRANAGWSREMESRRRFPAGPNSHAGYTLMVNAPVIVTDRATDTRFESKLFRPSEVTSGVAVMVPGREHPFGVLGAHTRLRREFTHDDANFLQAIANTLGLAIEKAGTESELRKRESYFRTLIENASDLITVLDLNGNIMFESPSIERLAGWKPEERIGRNSSDFFHPDEREMIAGAIGKTIADPDGLTTLRCRLLHKNGSWVLFDCLARAIRDPGGIPCVLANSRDITGSERALEELRQGESRFRGIFDGSLDGIVITNLDDASIADVNQAYTRIFGYSREETIGKTSVALGLWTNPDDGMYIVRTLRAKGWIENFEVDMRACDGRIVPTLLSSQVVDLGGRRCIVSIARDITERRKDAIVLAKARDAALESSRLKSAFLANMSHEIRTPLNVILGYTDLIGEHLAEGGDNSQDDFLAAIHRAGKRLLDTIRRVLDYSRLEAGGFEPDPSPVDLVPIIKARVQECLPAADEKGVALEIVVEQGMGEGAVVHFDQYCLSGALDQILQNAVKFTDHGSILVRLFHDEQGLALEVRDTGIGIDSAYLSRIFQPFTQEQTSHTRSFEGVGLGLALAHRFVALNGGLLSVASRKGEGSTFTIRLGASIETSPPIFPPD